jgi:hypothetical protein
LGEVQQSELGGKVSNRISLLQDRFHKIYKPLR